MANLLSRKYGPLAPVSEPIYHYTSAEGLYGALAARRLWATQATSLNDHAEIRQGWQLIIEVLEELLEAHPLDGFLDRMMDWARNPVDQVRHVCVVCASLRGDDANQWRLYGGASSGYAIELDPAVSLAAVAEAKEPLPPDPVPGQTLIDFNVVFVSGWLRVIYDRAVLHRAVHDLWRAVIDTVPPETDRTLSADDQEAEHSMWWNEVQAVALSELATLAHLVKPEGFAGENEVRTVVKHLLGADYMKYRPSPVGIVGFRELARSPQDHNLSRPYFIGESPGTLSHLPVRSIRVGPLTPGGHEATLQDYLDAVELESVRVERSQIPLR